VAAACVRRVRFTLDQVLRAPGIAQLRCAGAGLQEGVLRLGVPVTDAQRMDVRQRSEQLVHVQL
jgi:hypothetical protein